MPSTPQQLTVSSVIEDLRSRKHAHEFLMTHQGLSAGTGKFYNPGELKIIRTYRFEEESNPSYSSILYVIETNDGLKGYSLDAFGSYHNNKDVNYENFMNEISAEEEKDIV
jgi:hypothetical protein